MSSLGLNDVRLDVLVQVKFLDELGIKRKIFEVIDQILILFYGSLYAHHEVLMYKTGF